ncbi:MAG: hypothetical protein KDC54_12150 [Lewinella sp.]|nr:hypothetical protein [Lewinella sp.]
MALFLRGLGWSTEDVKSPELLFEPDEAQHMLIAQRQIFRLDTDLYDPAEVPTGMFNVRGFGNWTGLVSWLGHLRQDGPPPPAEIVMAGRRLSTFFSLALILVVFSLARRWWDDATALLAAALLAINDLNITYSHYAVPAVAYVCWLYLFVAVGWWHWRRDRWWSAAVLGWVVAAAFVFKLDFLPFFLGLGLLLWPRGAGRWPVRVAQLSTYFLAAALGFVLTSLFNFSLDDLSYVWRELNRQNSNAIPVDQHWLENPLIYTLGAMAAVGLPVFILALRGGLQAWRDRQRLTNEQWAGALLLLVLLVLEIGVRWTIDTPFVRRLNFLMPTLALAAAYALVRWWRRGRSGRVGVMAVMAYSLALMFVSQSNHWWDVRYAARAELAETIPDTARVYFSRYAYLPGMPDATAAEPTDADWLIIHETFYRRFGLSFTAPFGFPKCCNEVYHCWWGDDFCVFYQALLRDTQSDFVRVRTFSTREAFPERLLYHWLFGHFETFRGDLLVYRRR